MRRSRSMAARRSRPDARPRRGDRVMTGKGIVIREAHFPGRAPIEAYGNGGFRFADMSHRGSLLCLPTGIYGWEPKDSSALVPEDFARVFAEAENIEILLVGSGKELRPIPKP